MSIPSLRYLLAILAVAASPLLLVDAAPKPVAPRSFHCNGKTQLEMNQCAASELQRADAELARAVEAACARIADAEQCAKLATAQEAWAKFRAAECEARNWPSRRGSIYPMLRDGCLAGMALERISAIAELPLRP